jgi:hypothetical protein
MTFIRTLISLLLVGICGCSYHGIEPLPEKSPITHTKPVPLPGTWWLTKLTIGGCTDTSLDETDTIGDSFGTENWEFHSSDTLRLTRHGTQDFLLVYSINGNTLCLKQGTLLWGCYSFIQATDTLTLISQLGDPQESCVTERILVKVR